MTNITPTEGHIIVQRVEAERQHANGLLIPDQAQSQPDTATIIAVNAQNKHDLAVGDTVLLSGRYAGADFTVEGTLYTSVLEEEILAVLG